MAVVGSLKVKTFLSATSLVTNNTIIVTIISTITTMIINHHHHHHHYHHHPNHLQLNSSDDALGHWLSPVRDTGITAAAVQ